MVYHQNFDNLEVVIENTDEASIYAYIPFKGK